MKPGNITVIPLNGKVVTIEECRQVVRSVRESLSQGIMYVVLDFSQVEEISGSFAGFLTESKKIVEGMGKEIVLVGASKSVREMLGSNALDENMDLYENFMEFYRGVLAQAPALLVIDDDAEIREIVARTIKKSGFEILEAEDGATGVELYRREKDRIPLVILDLQMPGMNGEEALLRLMEIDADVRVLILTGHADLKRFAKLRGLSNLCFLTKPFLLNQLRDSINLMLARLNQGS